MVFSFDFMDRAIGFKAKSLVYLQFCDVDRIPTTKKVYEVFLHATKVSLIAVPFKHQKWNVMNPATTSATIHHNSNRIFAIPYSDTCTGFSYRNIF